MMPGSAGAGPPPGVGGPGGRPPAPGAPGGVVPAQGQRVGGAPAPGPIAPGPGGGGPGPGALGGAGGFRGPGAVAAAAGAQGLRIGGVASGPGVGGAEGGRPSLGASRSPGPGAAAALGRSAGPALGPGADGFRRLAGGAATGAAAPGVVPLTGQGQAAAGLVGAGRFGGGQALGGGQGGAPASGPAGAQVGAFRGPPVGGPRVPGGVPPPLGGAGRGGTGVGPKPQGPGSASASPAGPRPVTAAGAGAGPAAMQALPTGFRRPGLTGPPGGGPPKGRMGPGGVASASGVAGVNNPHGTPPHGPNNPGAQGPRSGIQTGRGPNPGGAGVPPGSHHMQVGLGSGQGLQQRPGSSGPNPGMPPRGGGPMGGPPQGGVAGPVGPGNLPPAVLGQRSLQGGVGPPPGAVPPPAGGGPNNPGAASGGNQGQSNPAGGGAGAGMRELKVEDALLYLDQVKMEFGDRPRIYNEFLEIMKNFKAQEIDTPGVIRRVSTLFQGYNNLILGFNTFLPEGFKIELKDLEGGGQYAPQGAAPPSHSQQQQPQQPQQGRGPGGPGQYGYPGSQQQQGPMSMGRGQPSPQQQPPRQLPHMQAQQGPPKATGGMPSQGAGPPNAGAGPPPRGPGGLPPSFQGRGGPLGGSVGPGTSPATGPTQQGGIPPGNKPPGGQPMGQPPHGVLSQQGGGGPPHLQQGQQGAQGQQPTQRGGGGQPPPTGPGGQRQPGGLMGQLPPQGGENMGPGAMPPNAAGRGPMQPQPQQHQQQGSGSGGAVEFDHAISYVTTIKKRFANDPRTYQTFLEILHTYQKEQRGIKEVLEQVSALFADHPDLLKEFTFFLPDAVQEQAKERLQRAAEEAHARRAMAAQQAAQAAQQAAQQAQVQAQPQGGVAAPGGTTAYGQPPFHVQQQQEPGGKKSSGVVPPPGRGGGPASSVVPAKAVSLSTSYQPAPPPPPPPGTQKFIDMTKSPSKTEKAPPTSPAPAVQHQRGTKRPFSPGVLVGPPPVAPAPVVALHPSPPEPSVYNAGVERQFFDAAKEALTSYSRDGGQAWAEFLKCLDMYAQEVLSRTEMLGFVEPLLGKRHAELFEEFKRMLAAAGTPGSAAAAHHDDAWHSVPLSEIDFSRCRKCSPSYRALPRDYPAPPCSERSVEESAVLNDVWVSLPVGSEESYTFRHMRKNQYEEMLFRTEDERFEIDMVIDSNAATLRRLEPVAEEIAQLSQTELSTPGISTSSSCSGGVVSSDEERTKAREKDALSSVSGGLGGKIFQYSLDKRILNTIHKNAISRLYGDAGPEMLALLFKNPAVSVPIVVKRLRQKDHEFRSAREVMNRRWRELALVNYYKSLDHRSLTWRTTDKRATSTRTLVAEIKDRAAHNGHEGEAALALRRDKAKEEFGSFYEVTKGKYLNKRMDLTNLPKPTKTLFTPHLSLIYESNSWAQRDAYRILAFALERGSISPGDKERCHRLWRDFLCHFFGLSVVWLHQPSISSASPPMHGAPSIVSNGEDSGNEDDESSGVDIEDAELDGDDIDVNEDIMKGPKERAHHNNSDGDDAEMMGDSASFLLDQQPIPPGAKVSTIFGEGTVVRYRRIDKIYIIDLSMGTRTYLNSKAVLCTLLPVERSSLTRQLRSSDNEALKGSDRLVVGTQSLYLFLRLHQVLVNRLNVAKELAYKVSHDRTLRSHIEQLSSDGDPDAGRKRYDAYLGLVYALVEGGYSSSSQYANAAEGGKYEDRVRCLLGGGAYQLATMDKLVSHILKNLQNMANDETMIGMVEVYRRHVEGGTFRPSAFRQEAGYLSEGENMYAFQHCDVPGADKSVVHFEFLGCIAETDQEMDNPDIEGMIRKEGNSVPSMVDAEDGIDENVQPQSSKRQRRGGS